MAAKFCFGRFFCVMNCFGTPSNRRANCWSILQWGTKSDIAEGG